MKNLGSWKCVFLVLFAFGMCMALAPQTQASTMVANDASSSNIQTASIENTAPNILVSNTSEDNYFKITESKNQPAEQCANCHPNGTKGVAQSSGQQSVFSNNTEKITIGSDAANLATIAPISVHNGLHSFNLLNTTMQTDDASASTQVQRLKHPMAASSTMAAGTFSVTISAVPASSSS